MLRPEDVRTRQDLAAFARELLAELDQKPSWWENTDLDRFLEAFGRWTSDMEGYFRNNELTEPEQPTWSLVARMLYAATMYE